MGQYMLYIWLAVLAICLIIELIDAGTLVSVWFSVGAFIPLLMSFWRTNNPWYITAQIVVFGIVSALCLIFLRKIALKLFYKNDKEKIGLDGLIGKKFKIKHVDEGVAYVKVNGIEYRAELSEGENLNESDEVEVVKFEGNKIIVKKVN